MSEMRWEWMVPCGECGECKGRVLCEPARKKLRRYSGIRPTSDGFDCALPVSIDSHSVCSYGCYYCFSDNLVQHRIGREQDIGQTPLREIEKLFSGEGKRYETLRRALKYDRRNAAGYPTAVQLGAICDPCDNIERNQGWLLKFIELAIKYNQPVRMSTKGRIFQSKEYQAAIAQAPHLFWVAFSIISPDDELLEQIDRRAPNATQRLETMKILSGLGVKTSLRFRPMLPGLSDRTPRYPEAYRVLIEKAAEAGAVAVSYEVVFVPGTMTKDLKWRWGEIERITKVPFKQLYKQFGPTQACMRPPYTWTENIMHAVAEVSHRNGMVVGVSDPCWKQLTDSGCCCGIMPDDPVFGNWQTESATNQLLIAKTTGKILGPEDIIPEWAYKQGMPGMINLGPGPQSAWGKSHIHWSDRLRRVWNGMEKQRSPLNYFQGALMPDHVDERGDVFYRYEGLKRQYLGQTPYWSVPPRV